MARARGLKVELMPKFERRLERDTLGTGDLQVAAFELDDEHPIGHGARGLHNRLNLLAGKRVTGAGLGAGLRQGR